MRICSSVSRWMVMILAVLDSKVSLSGISFSFFIFHFFIFIFHFSFFTFIFIFHFHSFILHFSFLIFLIFFSFLYTYSLYTPTCTITYVLSLYLFYLFFFVLLLHVLSLRLRGLVPERSINDAFSLFLSLFLVSKLLGERTMSTNLTTDDVKRVLEEVLVKNCDSFDSRNNDNRAGLAGAQPRSYASAVGSAGTRVRVSRGPTVELTGSISFLVVPDEKCGSKYTSSQVTKDTFHKVFKPLECGL